MLVAPLLGGRSLKPNLSAQEKRNIAKFVKHFMEGFPLHKAAKLAGSQAKGLPSLSRQGHRWLNKAQLTDKEILDAHGLDGDTMARKLTEGLGAKRQIAATFRGQIGEVREFPDHPARAKYLELLGRMRGSFVDRVKVEDGGGDITLNITSTKIKSKNTIINLD